MLPNSKVTVTAQAKFIPHQSDTNNKRYVFSYTITINNDSETACQLLSRHWIINDANHKVEEIYGDGVIGEQPIINPGKSYTYTSGAILETEMGTMEGKYFMIEVKKEKTNTDKFEVLVPKFLLSIPRTLH